MQYHLTNLVHEENILVGLETNTAEGTIRALSDILVKNCHVTPTFADNVWEREQGSPTGLPTEPYAVAIPHTDPTFVLQSSIAVGVLSEGVTFGQMASNNRESVSARIIFLLAIRETEKQVVMIQELMQLLQNPNHLTELANAKTPLDVKRVLR